MYLLNSVSGAGKNTVYAVSSWGGEPGYSALYKLDFTLGIDNLRMPGRKFSIHPNPAKDILKMRMQDDQCNDYRVNVYNMTGQVILENLVKPDKINVSGFYPGVYSIEIISEDWVGQEKMLVTK